MIIVNAEDPRRARAGSSAAIDGPVPTSWISNVGKADCPSQPPWRRSPAVAAAEKKAGYARVVGRPHDDTMITDQYLSVPWPAKDWKSGSSMRNGA